MKTKAADAEKQAAAITQAIKKAKADMSNSVDPAAQETVQKCHAEELWSLEEKLTSKHEAVLKTRVENAVTEALKAKPTINADTDQKAAIEAAITDYEKQAQACCAEKTALIKACHGEDIASAIDHGHLEQAAKKKRMYSQLVRAQKRVKELEALIHKWEVQGIKLPQISSTTATTAPDPSTASPVQQAAKLPALNTSTSGAGPSQPKLTPTAPAAANAGTLPPRRPAPAGPAGTSPMGPGRGGAVQGVGCSLHMATQGALQMAPVKPSAPSPASDTPPVGVLIIGATTKRPCEEGSSDDQSLAKHIKAVEPMPWWPNAPAE